jgi:gamma-glutamyltranspeptidase/glutathione hydrolase
MVISLPPGNDTDAVAIDFRETAPAAVGSGYYMDLADSAASRAGVHAVGVPGSVAGLLYALQRYGTLDRATVLEPAIRAARDGIEADSSWVDGARVLAERLDRHPDLRGGAARIVTDLCLDGDVVVGDLVRNPQHARALRLIAEQGREAFYKGPIADAIVATMQAGGGPLNHADLAGYRIRVSEPLRGSFRGLEILTMPPPSSGGVAVLQILGILDRRLDETAHATPADSAYMHLVTEAMKHAFADRATWLADAAFVEVPVDRLLDDGYLDARAASISPQGTRPTRQYGSHAPPVEDGGTSHFSIIDGQGMAVACTQTINLEYGSLVAVPGFGFMLNNEMDDFTTIPGEPNAFGLQQSDRNLPQAGKRPLSSMSPMIVRRGGRPILIAGASGGPRIISGTLQCVLNCLLFGMTPREAVAAPRFHHQWQPDILYFEEDWSDQAVIETMEALGHQAGRRADIGVVQLISVRDDGIHAASDPRKGGAPDGM